MAGFDLSPSHDQEHQSCRERAQGWLARFAPLVMDDSGVTDDQLRERLQLIEQLNQDSVQLQPQLEALVELDDVELRQTFRRAVTQLDSLQVDLRKRLARVAPGDPTGLVDLEALQERLEERAARQEMGLATTQEVPSILKMKTAPGNLAAAAFLGLFSFGWNAFTIFHATLMIGGMAKAFGWFALLLLGFYAIFFAAGFGMAWAAFMTASTEEIELDGAELTIRRCLGPLTRTKRAVLDRQSRARIGEATVGWMQTSGNGRRSKPTPAILLSAIDGSEVSLGMNASSESRERTMHQINAYLDAKAELDD